MSKFSRGFGLENIMPQNGFLFRELTTVIHGLRLDGTYTTKAILETGIDKIIQHSTGMLIDFNVTDVTDIGAWVQLPTLDKNHPFANEWVREVYKSTAGISAIDLVANKAVGSTDIARGVVGGLYSKVRISLTVTKGMLVSSFTDAEIAAIVLHELGHAFTYFESLGTVVRTSLIASTTAKVVMGVVEPAEKVKALKVGARHLGIELLNPDKLATTPSDKVGDDVQMVFLSACAAKQRSEQGISVYETRYCEQLADQFAVRHGAGKDLTIALDKMYRIHSASTYRSSAMHMVFETVRFMLFWGGSIVASIGVGIGAMGLGFMYPIIALLTNPHVKLYDDPAARLTFIKRQIIDELKDVHLDKSRKLTILSDLEAVNTVLENCSDKLTWSQWLWSNVLPTGRRLASQEDVQKDLEALLHNTLFQHAAKFSTLVK